MRDFVEDYYSKIEQLLKSVEVVDKQEKEYDFYEAIANTAEFIETRTTCGAKLIFIGNGASATISSHQATDFWKNGGMKAIAFNDASGLTCISNDFGYRHVFEKPIEMFADPGDILVAISSSGRSENIVLGALAARTKGAKVITLSGFEENNPLRKLGEINFYVPSFHYGHVEILHLSICHCLFDSIVQKKREEIVEVIGNMKPADLYSGSRDSAAIQKSEPEIKAIPEGKKYKGDIVLPGKPKSSANS